MKNKRQSEILRIVNEKKIKKHEQLLDELTAAGYDVTQATVSRDIKELGLIKIQNGSEGSFYATASSVSENVNPKLDMFSDSVKDISCAMHTVVVRTYPGMASAVAASVDSMMHNEILGSIAGDDTLLIICSDAEKAVETTDKLKKIFKS